MSPFYTRMPNVAGVGVERTFKINSPRIEKIEVVTRILQSQARGLTMIFTRTKRAAQRVADELVADIRQRDSRRYRKQGQQDRFGEKLAGNPKSASADGSVRFWDINGGNQDSNPGEFTDIGGGTVLFSATTSTDPSGRFATQPVRPRARARRRM